MCCMQRDLVGGLVISNIEVTYDNIKCYNKIAGCIQCWNSIREVGMVWGNGVGMVGGGKNPAASPPIPTPLPHTTPTSLIEFQHWIQPVILF